MELFKSNQHSQALLDISTTLRNQEPLFTWCQVPSGGIDLRKFDIDLIFKKINDRGINTSTKTCFASVTRS